MIVRQTKKESLFIYLVTDSYRHWQKQVFSLTIQCYCILYQFWQVPLVNKFVCEHNKTYFSSVSVVLLTLIYDSDIFSQCQVTADVNKLNVNKHFIKVYLLLV